MCGACLVIPCSDKALIYYTIGKPCKYYKEPLNNLHMHFFTVFVIHWPPCGILSDVNTSCWCLVILHMVAIIFDVYLVILGVVNRYPQLQPRTAYDCTAAHDFSLLHWLAAMFYNVSQPSLSYSALLTVPYTQLFQLVPCNWLGNTTGTRNPRVNVTGCSGVRVRVAKFVPSENPYPCHGLTGFDWS